MSIRRAIIEIDTKTVNVSEFCREHGITRWFFYELRRRHAVEGDTVLVPRSRAPKRVANRTVEAVEDVIVEVRKRLEADGFDAGPATIRTLLSAELDAGVPVPSQATIWRVLTRRGFVTPHPERAPKHAYRTFTAERVNECWQIDDTGWALADSTEVKIIDIVDDHSRTVIASRAVATVNKHAFFDTMCLGGKEWGWPARILTDNAPALLSLADQIAHLGISSGHSRPYHPQTCGKVERFHQTLKKFLRARPAATSLHELQTLLDTFSDHYNHHRPHTAIGGRTPANVHATGPHSGPADHPITARTRIHHVTVTGGVCHINKDYAIPIGATHNRETATVVITGLACHIFIAGTHIRALTLNPTRRYQPLHDRPGRPTQTVRDVPRHL
ncbi:MAG: integrase core domain-containing protein [Acidimicrobiia bacterium]|nr:integrase core domain-containing protein [Acidimicrobiia bacterium]